MTTTIVEKETKPVRQFVTVDHNTLVEISCKIADNPGCTESQGSIEYFLFDAVRAITGVDFFKDEQRLIDGEKYLEKNGEELSE